ncbi:NAD(P)H-dependent glycerol-3-phosphate dehydrogenase [Candidatus Nitrosacidococcus sp. I8]|uniref:NAD(P)H-dependent glycerol-3-phosphate dehydrogenase n=1 Tax=Candidatus Nitrosacidococcus sp. I8 TaxID=2942908 RepID=UPI0022272600|nr:NAD(P)H-dependent glycerol-3-phosphate dehydrogenase [Candidatus Nitrosacidococcus sp. I8]CAH9014095.1 Glycerol-3-phosphate dehydrogenase [NAD(P)+] [Candidatus Nitrosacidococcus sp. I8]
MNFNSQNTLVLGAGSWGTALAVLLARNKTPTYLWGRDQKQVEIMTREGCNQRYLPNISFPPLLTPIYDLQQALKHTNQIIIAVPSHAFRLTLECITFRNIPIKTPIIWATKGLELGTGRLLHEVAIEVLGSDYPIAILSGPTFAHEVAMGLPTAVTIATTYPAVFTYLAHCLHGNTFRLYTSNDLIGVQLGGAVKNILAIAAGISDGLGFGSNTRAALITRGLAELIRLALANGAKKETLMGLSCLGDLTLTCTDNQSRNRRLGLALAQGKTLSEALALIDQVVEGIEAARLVSIRARQANVEMPIVEQVYQVLYCNQDPKRAVEMLLNREQKPEHT